MRRRSSREAITSWMVDTRPSDVGGPHPPGMTSTEQDAPISTSSATPPRCGGQFASTTLRPSTISSARWISASAMITSAGELGRLTTRGCMRSLPATPLTRPDSQRRTAPTSGRDASIACSTVTSADSRVARYRPHSSTHVVESDSSTATSMRALLSSDSGWDGSRARSTGTVDRRSTRWATVPTHRFVPARPPRRPSTTRSARCSAAARTICSCGVPMRTSSRTRPGAIESRSARSRTAGSGAGASRA